MTEKELDAFMSKVLLDAIAFDENPLCCVCTTPASNASDAERSRALDKRTGQACLEKGAADSSSHIIDAVIGTWQRDACQPDRSGDDCSVGYRMV